MSFSNAQLSLTQFHFPRSKGGIDENVNWSTDVNTHHSARYTQHLLQQHNSLPATHRNVLDIPDDFVVGFSFTESTTVPMEEYFSGPSIDRSRDPPQEPEQCENIRKKLCRLHNFCGIQCSLLPSHLFEPCSKCTSGKPTEEFNNIFPSTQNHDSDDSIFVFEM
jgi:hypothetical protein